MQGDGADGGGWWWAVVEGGGQWCKGVDWGRRSRAARVLGVTTNPVLLVEHIHRPGAEGLGDQPDLALGQAVRVADALPRLLARFDEGGGEDAAKQGGRKRSKGRRKGRRQNASS